MASNREIRQRIKQRRTELGLTLQEVADRVGVQNSTIHRYEAGEIEKIKIPVVKSIANALNVSSSWLLGIADSQAEFLPATEGENEPLHDDEFQAMNGKPVWCKELGLWAILYVEQIGRWAGVPFICGVYGLEMGVATPFEFNVQQHGYTLYRHPPKET